MFNKVIVSSIFALVIGAAIAGSTTYIMWLRSDIERIEAHSNEVQVSRNNLITTVEELKANGLLLREEALKNNVFLP